MPVSLYRRRLALVLSTLAAPGGALFAASYPRQPVRLVVSFPPGSGSDTTARHYARRLAEIAGQQFVVENRPGANSFIAAQLVAKAAPDGHTLFFASNSPVAVNPALFKSMPYDPSRDLVPVARASRATNLLCVGAESPYRNMKDLLAAAREKPGTLSYASGSAAYHIATSLFAQRAGIQLQHIPYKGAAPAAIDVASGLTSLTITDLTAALPMVRSGRLRALLVTADRRHPALPEVPTAVEAGVPAFEYYNWTGLFAPAATGPEIVSSLARWMRQVTFEPQTSAFLAGVGAEPFWADPREFKAYQDEQIAWWRHAAVRAGIEKE